MDLNDHTDVGSQSIDHAGGQLASTVHEDGNGRLNGHAFGMHELLHALQAMRIGDFSVRLPSDRTGLEGKIADTFNEIVAANERMASELAHVGQVVGREGKTRTRVKFGLQSGSWAAMEASVNDLVDDLLWPTTAVTHAITAVAQGDLLQTVRLDVDGRPLQGEFLRLATIVNTMIKQLSVFTSEVTRVAREVGTDGKLGGQAQVREVTGVWKDLTEVSELDGVQPDGAGAQHRRRDDRGGQRRPVEEDHRGRARRDPATQGSHQHDGGSVAVVRLGGDSRRARGGHRGQAGRTGGGAGRGRHVEGPDRQRERDVRQPDRPGAQHRAGDDGGGARRPVAQDHRRCARRDPGAEGDHQHDGGSAQRVRRRGDARGARGGHRGAAGRAGERAWRRRHVEGPHRQRELDGGEPDGAGAQHRRGRHRDRRRRPVEEDHGECVGRDPAVEGDHQHDGRSAQRVRRRGDARGARGRHRRSAGRAGERARCGGDVEGSD